MMFGGWLFVGLVLPRGAFLGLNKFDGSVLIVFDVDDFEFVFVMFVDLDGCVIW